MREYGFSLTNIFPYKDRIYGKIRARKNAYSRIFYVVSLKQVPNFKTMVRAVFNILNTA